jgi:hypothetical protein
MIDRSGHRPNEEVGKEAAWLTRQSLMVATREREAFGLKPSDSEVFHQRFENFREHLSCDKRFSESSASDMIENQDDTFSGGASQILESIEARLGRLGRQDGAGTSDVTANLPVSNILTMLRMSWLISSRTQNFMVL